MVLEAVALEKLMKETVFEAGGLLRGRSATACEYGPRKGIR